MRINKKRITILIIVIFVLLVFFSRTVYTYNMPRITGVRPQRGALNKLEMSSGIAKWADIENIFAPVSGIVGRVYVREGDRVEEGQVLFEMEFNIQAADRRLSEIENNIIKMESDIISLSNRLKIIQEGLAARNGIVPDYSSPDAGLIVMEINKAFTALQDARTQIGFGMISGNELVNIENNFRALIYKYEAEINSIEYSIAHKKIDLHILTLTRDASAETLADYRNNAVIRAPMDGVIQDIFAERGKYFNENALLVSIGIGNDFIVECNISLDNNFVNPGDTCQLVNSNRVINGNVTRVRPRSDGKTAVISITSGDISDGETFNITFEKRSGASFTLVPNRAINKDNDGYFLYQIKRRNGFMGQEYYIDRLNIFIGDSDHQNTVVSRGITFFEPIVLVSDKSLAAGMSVTLKNAEDFFEN